MGGEEGWIDWLGIFFFPVYKADILTLAFV